MTYEQIIQQVGKQIKKEVYYINENNQTVNISEDNIEEINIKFNAPVIGTLMKCVELVLKEEIGANKGIYAKITATFGNNTATKTYGAYFIENIEYDASQKTYTHTCYDAFLPTMVEYEPITITYPTTIQNFYNELIETLGLTSSVSLVNGNISMEKDIYDGINYSYRSVIDDIAEANGVLLYIDGSEIKEATYGTEANKVTINDDILKNSNIEFGKHFGAINVIVLARAGDSDRIYYPETVPDDPKEFKISENQLMNENNRSMYMPGLYQKLNGIEFDIYDTELVGYGGFTPLQKINFVTGEETYTSYVFNNEIHLTNGYSESIYTDEPDESKTNYKVADTTDQRINQAYVIVNKQSQEIEALTSRVEKVEEGDDSRNYATIETVNRLIANATDGLVNTFSKTGGSNLLRNPIGYFGNEYWDGDNHTPYRDTETENQSGEKSCWLLQEGTATQQITVKKGTYTLSCIYKKLLATANISISINNVTYELTETSYTTFIKTFTVENNNIEVKLTSDNDNAGYILNLMVNYGTEAINYSNNANETISDSVTIGKGIEINATGSDVKFNAQADGIRMLSTKTNEVVTEFTSKGIITDNIEANNGIIGKVVFKDTGYQTFINRVGD